MIFKPTPISIAIFIIVCGICIFHIPVVFSLPVSVLSFSLAFMFFHFGKVAENKNNKLEQRRLVAKTLEDESSSQTVLLFPDVQYDLLLKSINIYREIEDFEKAATLIELLNQIK
jgi:hypothetical protein